VDLRWAHEDNPTWDDDKQRVIGSAPEGALDIAYTLGTALPGDWWSARDESGAAVGYGWLDATWGGDAEILLAVDAAAQQHGAGSFIIGHLEDEAARRGLNYVYNTVRASHPNRDDLHDWLAVRGYRGGNSDTTLRKHVRNLVVDEATLPTATTQADELDADELASARPPGDEESGGYVNVDEHQY
jgi:GNAT superfamily N-acetyltransferase